jgi:hypothetical protein
LSLDTYAKRRVFERLGKVGYAAYNEHQGGVNFEGKPIPTWDENKREDIKAAWDRASEAIADEVIATIEKQLLAGHTREAVIHNARLYFGTRPARRPAITHSGDSG